MNRRILLLAVALFGWPVAAVATEIPRQTRELLSQMPLFFEPSKDGFVSRGDGYLLALTHMGAALHLRGRPSCCGQEAPTAVLRLQLVGSNPRPTMRGVGKLPGVSHYFVGDPAAWRTDVSQFEKVEYQEAYPGVGLVFYGNERQFEFDFVVSPGADPSPIALDFEGADSLRLEENGNLLLATGQGEVLLHKPRVFQEVAGKQIPIAGDFVLDGEARVRFSLGTYDPAKPLIIDPVLSFASYVGATGDDVALDSSGHVYVVGSTFQKNLATTAGVVQPAKAPGDTADVYLLKFDPNGSRVIYATYLGGSGADLAFGIAVDGEGNAVITGRTFSQDFPLANAIQSKLGGEQDAFVAKLDPTGSRLTYSTYLGGKPRFEMEPLSIDFGRVTRGQPKDVTITIRNTGTTPFAVCATVGGFGTSFVGATESCSTIFGPKSEPKITVPPLSQASLIVRWDPIGRGHDKSTVNLWNETRDFFAEIPWKGEGIVPPFPPDPPPPPDDKTYRNKPPFFYVSLDSQDTAFGIALDQAGNAYVTGQTASANFPVLNAMQSTHGGIGDGIFSEHDAFVTKFSPTGQLIYSTYLGGNSGDGAGGIAVDREGNSYIAGSTSSSNFASTASIHPFEAKAGNGFVVKLNPAGSARIYSTILGASITDIAVDDIGAAYVTGWGGHANLPTPTAFQKEFRGPRDAFAAKLNPDGSSLAYFTRLGGSGWDEGYGIAVDTAGSACVVGETTSADFPLKDAAQATFGGEGSSFLGGGRGDAFVTQLTSDGSATVFSTYLGGAGGDRATAVAVDQQARIVIAGSTGGGIATKNPLAGITSISGGFVAMFTGGQVAQEVQLWQKIEIAAPTGNDGASAFKVEFVRMIDGKETRVEAEILAVRPGFVTVRVPPGLLEPADVNAP